MPLALGMTQLEHSAFDLGDTLPTLRGVGVTQLEHCALKLGDTLVPLALGMTHNVRVVPSGKYLPREELPTGQKLSRVNHMHFNTACKASTMEESRFCFWTKVL